MLRNRHALALGITFDTAGVNISTTNFQSRARTPQSLFDRKQDQPGFKDVASGFRNEDLLPYEIEIRRTSTTHQDHDVVALRHIPGMIHLAGNHDVTPQPE